MSPTVCCLLLAYGAADKQCHMHTYGCHFRHNDNTTKSRVISECISTVEGENNFGQFGSLSQRAGQSAMTGSTEKSTPTKKSEDGWLVGSFSQYREEWPERLLPENTEAGPALRSEHPAPRRSKQTIKEAVFVEIVCIHNQTQNGNTAPH